MTFGLRGMGTNKLGQLYLHANVHTALLLFHLGRLLVNPSKTEHNTLALQARLVAESLSSSNGGIRLTGQRVFAFLQKLRATIVVLS